MSRTGRGLKALLRIWLLCFRVGEKIKVWVLKLTSQNYYVCYKNYSSYYKAYYSCCYYVVHSNPHRVTSIDNEEQDYPTLACKYSNIILLQIL